jgi:hypothetical protein
MVIKIQYLKRGLHFWCSKMSPIRKPPQEKRRADIIGRAAVLQHRTAGRGWGTLMGTSSESAPVSASQSFRTAKEKVKAEKFARQLRGCFYA